MPVLWADLRASCGAARPRCHVGSVLRAALAWPVSSPFPVEGQHCVWECSLPRPAGGKPGLTGQGKSQPAQGAELRAGFLAVLEELHSRKGPAWVCSLTHGRWGQPGDQADSQGYAVTGHHPM